LNGVNGKEPVEVNRNQQADSDAAKWQLEKKRHSFKESAGQIHDMEFHRKKSALFNLKKRPFAQTPQSENEKLQSENEKVQSNHFFRFDRLKSLQP